MAYTKSNWPNHFTTTNYPNGVKDLVTGVVYEYENGNSASREAADRAARDAQISAVGTLISGNYITADDVGDLATLQRAYAASQA